MKCTRKFAGLLAMAIIASSILLLALSKDHSAYAQENKAQGIMVPLYTYPGGSWDTLEKTKKEYPSVSIVAIVNPASGPGYHKDGNYENGIAKLQDAGVVVIGYVSTAYTGRDINSVKSDIDRWASWYPAIDGIFFDEQTNQAGGEWYYDQLDKYAKSKGLPFTVGNPGANSIPSYLDTVDVVLIYESPGLPNLANYAVWEKHDNTKLGMIPFAVGSIPKQWIMDSAQNVGWIYVTDDVLSNPWDSLPYYFEEMAGLVKENNDKNGIKIANPKTLSDPVANENTSDRQDLQVKASRSGHGATVKNPRDGESVYKFVLEFAPNLEVDSEKAPKGWVVRADSDAGMTSVIFETEDRPLKAGRSKIFSVDTGDDGKRGTTRIVASWSAYDEEGTLVDKGSVKLRAK